MGKRPTNGNEQCLFSLLLCALKLRAGLLVGRDRPVYGSSQETEAVMGDLARGGGEWRGAVRRL